jgi:peroxiredoxin/outer membrane lipoprotein-sorting protein
VTRDMTFQDDPKAHALYDRMVDVTSRATSLFYESLFDWWYGPEQIEAYTYRLWIRKRPIGVRVEHLHEGAPTGVLVGDGRQTWVYWPGGRPPIRWDDPAEYERTRFTSYAKEGPDLVRLGYSLSLVGTEVTPVLGPSSEWGLEDAHSQGRDSMRRLGSEEVDGEVCDVIEISHLQGLRVKTLWLAQRDGLPRRLAEAIQAATELVKHEESVRIRLDEEFPPELFVWEPPEGWEEWRKPDPAARRLAPGTEAPDFEATAVDGRRVRLSDYRGQVVWLVIWRLTCPPCREEIPYLEQWHRRCADAGLAIIGFNYGDKAETARAFFQEHGITFTNIVDGTEAAWEWMMDSYPHGGVPANTIIDRGGKVAGSWDGYSGYSQGPSGARVPPEREILQRLGILRPNEPVGDLLPTPG